MVYNVARHWKGVCNEKNLFDDPSDDVDKHRND